MVHMRGSVARMGAWGVRAARGAESAAQYAMRGFESESPGKDAVYVTRRGKSSRGVYLRASEGVYKNRGPYINFRCHKVDIYEKTPNNAKKNAIQRIYTYLYLYQEKYSRKT